MKKIIKNENSILRKIAKEVPIKDIKTSKTQKLLKDMSAALSAQKNGVAIAAPQIGVSLRVFIVSGKLFDIKENPPAGGDTSTHLDLVFINPKIAKVSKDASSEEEGCLSIVGKYGTVNRPNKTTIRAYNENGKVFERGGSGLLSKIFQHEMDHLNGILYIDKAEEIYNHDKK